MNQLDKNIAVNLKRIRKSRNMSLDMLAEKTGVSKSMLGQIERGESNPTVATIAKIVDGIRVTFEELIYPKTDSVVIIDNETLPVYKSQEGVYQVRSIFPYDTGTLKYMKQPLNQEKSAAVFLQKEAPVSILWSCREY